MYDLCAFSVAYDVMIYVPEGDTNAERLFCRYVLEFCMGRFFQTQGPYSRGHSIKHRKG